MRSPRPTTRWPYCPAQRATCRHEHDRATAATLLDQRDAYIDKLSQLMDINVVQGNFDQVNVFTNSGVQLVGTTASTLAFNAQGTVSAACTMETRTRTKAASARSR